MSLNTKPTFDAIQSLVAATGFFHQVNTHEPKNAPATSGLSAAIWADRIAPTQSSGIATTSAVVVYMCRLYGSMLSEPQDLIDPTMQAAADQILTDLSGDFELGGNARAVDVFGMSGVASLQAQAGYVTVDTTMFRVIDITVPVIINDAWDQTP